MDIELIKNVIIAIFVAEWIINGIIAIAILLNIIVIRLVNKIWKTKK